MTKLLVILAVGALAVIAEVVQSRLHNKVWFEGRTDEQLERADRYRARAMVYFFAGIALAWVNNQWLHSELGISAAIGLVLVSLGYVFYGEQRVGTGRTLTAVALVLGGLAVGVAALLTGWLPGYTPAPVSPVRVSVVVLLIGLLFAAAARLARP